MGRRAQFGYTPGVRRYYGTGSRPRVCESRAFSP
nr:MAG TPA: hypothetical protein [Myoviridae sp. ctbeQ1]